MMLQKSTPHVACRSLRWWASGWKAGFSFEKAADATAFEAPPANTDAFKKLVKDNNELSNLSDGRFPRIDKFLYEAVGSNHTNMFLHCVKKRCITDLRDFDLVDCDGKLDIELATSQPDFVDACERGLEWTIIPHEVQQRVPGIADFIQRLAGPPPCNIFQTYCLRCAPSSSLVCIT